MTEISIFGSTGSIGQKMVEVVLSNPDVFKVMCLSCKSNARLIWEQSKKLHPKYVVVSDTEAYRTLKKEIPNVLPKEELNNIAQMNVDVVGMAIPGNSGIEPSFSCLGYSKLLAIANKETIVSGGNFFISKAKKLKTKIIPVDSEHSAIYQCLQNEFLNTVRQVILTCSGGPFIDYSIDMLKKVTAKDAMKHPTWKMGEKISIDSATLINKALELIEAAFLFNIDINKITAIIHRQSMIHGMVYFSDNTVKAILSKPDMIIPIRYALHCGKRVDTGSKGIGFKIQDLLFEDFNNWQKRSINFAYDAYNEKKCIAFNVANERAVTDFLANRIQFTAIHDIVEKALEKAQPEIINSVDDIMQIIKS
jgi:1-deoxy-D-xylulose-5-phosphate reductoisomerase